MKKHNVFCVIGSEYFHRLKAIERIKKRLTKEETFDVLTIFPDQITLSGVDEMIRSLGWGRKKILLFKCAQNLPLSLKEFLLKKLITDKNLPHFIFEFDRSYSELIKDKKLKEDTLFRYLIKKATIIKTFSIPLKDPTFDFINAFYRKDFSQAIYFLEKIFDTSSVHPAVLSTKLLGRLVKSFSYYFVGEEKTKIFSSLWEADRCIKEKGQDPKLVLERLVIKLASEVNPS